MRILLAALTLLPASMPLAQDAEEPASTSGHLHAADVANDVGAVWFTEDQMMILQSLGHQMAVGTSCPGYTFDEAALNAQLDQLVALHEPKEGTDPEHYRSAAALVVGIHYGGGLVLAGQDYDGYCQTAAEEFADTPEDAPMILVQG